MTMIYQRPSFSDIILVLESVIRLFENNQTLSAMVQIGRAIEMTKQLGIHIEEKHEMFEKVNAALQDEICKLLGGNEVKSKPDALHDKSFDETTTTEFFNPKDKSGYYRMKDNSNEDEK